MKKFTWLLLLTVIFLGCFTNKKSTEKNEKMSFEPSYVPGPPTIIYKTKADYYNKVPVILNEDKTKIVAYFSPSDFIKNGKIVYPTKLKDGYLLDNIGINENVAFTDFDIDKYTKTMRMITVSELYKHIIDKDPLVEMYDCGNRSKIENLETTLNQVIENGQLKNCKKLK